MAPTQGRHEKGDALSTPKRDIFPFMSLPAELRIQIYELATASSDICVPSRHRPRALICPHCYLTRREIATAPTLFPLQIRTLLQIKQIRDDMLPHLHLSWVGGLEDRMDPSWDTFKQFAIPAVSHLTIGIDTLFNTRERSTRVCRRPRRLLRWMQRRSQETSGRGWNLTHLTLIEGSNNWPDNPHHIDHRVLIKIAGAEEIPGRSEAMARHFPMIKGLRSLKLVFTEDPDPALLDGLSKKCEAHGVDVEFVVPEEQVGNWLMIEQ